MSLRTPWLRITVVVLGAAGAVAIIWWRGPAWSDFANTFSKVEWRWVVSAILLNLLSVIARSMAWKTVIDQAVPAPRPGYRIVFAGFFTAGAKLEVGDGKLKIVSEGKTKKFVRNAEHITFSGVLGRERDQQVTYVTERCVIELARDGLVVTEVAPGIDLQRDVLEQAEIPLRVSTKLRLMPEALFRPARFGLELKAQELRRG